MLTGLFKSNEHYSTFTFRLSFKLLGADALALHERSLLGLSVVLVRLLALAAFPPNT
jgi:hypothetical protein